jgi:hypothetical protein
VERAWRLKEETKSGVSTISLGRLQYIRLVTAGPTQKTKTKTKTKGKQDETLVYLAHINPIIVVLFLRRGKKFNSFE